MVLAWRLGTACLPRYASKYSRHDFTLPQLFACLVVRQFFNLSYRRTAALLADCPEWLAAVELSRVPDHRTLCDAFDAVAAVAPVEAMLDHLAACFAAEGLLAVDDKPLAIDSSGYESRHVSRHFERRQGQGRPATAVQSDRSATVRGLPELAVGVATACHLVLAAWATTGAGADEEHWRPVLADACRRAKVRLVVADAGYDSEAAHRFARDERGVAAVRPAGPRPAEGQAPADPVPRADAGGVRQRVGGRGVRAAVGRSRR